MGVRRQRGLTLMEILIALGVGLFIMAAVIQVFVSSRHINRTQEALSRIQENGRFAIEVLARDVRQGGFKGACPLDVPVNNLLDPTGTGYSAALFDPNGTLTGWNDSAGPQAGAMTGYRAGTDVMVLRHAAVASDATASIDTPANANTINLTSDSGIAKGAIVVVSDSEGCDIFQNREEKGESTLTRGATGEPGNLDPGTNDFSKAYGLDMEIRLFTSTLYYVGTGASGEPTLRRIRYDSGSSTPPDEELVEGVWDMQILYGIDTSIPSNRIVDQYVTANNVTNWNRVSAVRISLLLRSIENNVVDEEMSLPYNGATFTAATNDRRMYQVFTTTIGLRNRLP